MVLSTHDWRRAEPVHCPAKTGRMLDRFVRPRVRLCECGSLTSLAECTGMVQLNPQDPKAYRRRGPRGESLVMSSATTRIVDTLMRLSATFDNRCAIGILRKVWS